MEKANMMNRQGISAGYGKMDLLGSFKERNPAALKIKQNSKSKSKQRNEDVHKGNGILNLFLKILLPKSITMTPPPNREIYY